MAAYSTQMYFCAVIASELSFSEVLASYGTFPPEVS